MQPTLHAIFQRLSELTGQSQSKLVFELLDGVQQPLMRVVRLLETADQAKLNLSGSVAASLDDAQDRVERQLGLVLADLGEPEFITESMFAERVPFRSRPKAARGKRSSPEQPLEIVPKPPSSNRGVRSLTNSKKTTTAGVKK